eukprot:IDg1252t1
MSFATRGTRRLRSSITDVACEDADIDEDLRTLEQCADTVRCCEEAGVRAVREVHAALQKGASLDQQRWTYAKCRAEFASAEDALERVEAAAVSVRSRRPMYIEERTSLAARRYTTLLKEVGKLAAREPRRTMVRMRFIDHLENSS